jgi:hypothetical protein
MNKLGKLAMHYCWGLLATMFNVNTTGITLS